jgi:hypothetical protein
VRAEDTAGGTSVSFAPWSARWQPSPGRGAVALAPAGRPVDPVSSAAVLEGHLRRQSDPRAPSSSRGPRNVQIEVEAGAAEDAAHGGGVVVGTFDALPAREPRG